MGKEKNDVLLRVKKNIDIGERERENWGSNRFAKEIVR